MTVPIIGWSTLAFMLLAAFIVQTFARRKTDALLILIVAGCVMELVALDQFVSGYSQQTPGLELVGLFGIACGAFVIIFCWDLYDRTNKKQAEEVGLREEIEEFRRKSRLDELHRNTLSQTNQRLRTENRRLSGNIGRLNIVLGRRGGGVEILPRHVRVEHSDGRFEIIPIEEAHLHVGGVGRSIRPMEQTTEQIEHIGAGGDSPEDTRMDSHPGGPASVESPMLRAFEDATQDLLEIAQAQGITVAEVQERLKDAMDKALQQQIAEPSPKPKPAKPEQTPQRKLRKESF